MIRVHFNYDDIDYSKYKTFVVSTVANYLDELPNKKKYLKMRQSNTWKYLSKKIPNIQKVITTTAVLLNSKKPTKLGKPFFFSINGITIVCSHPFYMLNTIHPSDFATNIQNISLLYDNSRFLLTSPFFESGPVLFDGVTAAPYSTTRSELISLAILDLFTRGVTSSNSVDIDFAFVNTINCNNPRSLSLLREDYTYTITNYNSITREILSVTEENDHVLSITF